MTGPPQNSDRESSLAPVFIVGCGRSGTTLLRLILNAQSQLAVPPESHFIYQLARRRAIGRWPASLRRERDWTRLIDFFDNHPQLRQWQLSRSELRACLQRSARSHRAAIENIFLLYAHRAGKQRWGDKTPMHVIYMLLLNEWFPTAKFVHVVRDGRDVALSLLTRKWGPNHISLAGYYWKWLVMSGMTFGAMLGPSRYLQVRFEDLLAEPETVVQGVCARLQLRYEPKMLDFYNTRAAQDYAKLGVKSQKLITPIDPSRKLLWKTAMSRRDQQSMLRQCGALLAYLGYPVDSLSRSCRLEQARIDDLLAAAVIEQISRDSPAYAAGELRQVGLLAANRARRVMHFATGNFRQWTHLGVRWQRTVAHMLD